MRGFDYVSKRLFFAAVTVFVAITLNFVLFRTLSGDARWSLLDEWERVRESEPPHPDHLRTRAGCRACGRA